MITNQEWSLSINNFGQVVEGIDDIIQCINIIFTTQKGSDPFRPDFGIDLMNWLDKPVEIAAAGLVTEMIAALDYEPRAAVTGIITKIEFNKIRFNIQGTVGKDLNTDQNDINIVFVLALEDGTIFLTENNTGVYIQ